jgi:hypothetical protein
VKVGPKERATDLLDGQELVLTGLRSTEFELNFCAAEGSKTQVQDTKTHTPVPRRCDLLRMRVSGEARGVDAGRPGYVASLKPSWLQFLNDSSTPGLLWGAGLFLWGTGWSIWRALAK